VSVGAGTGSYEPRDRPVAAVEPSAVIWRSGPGSVPAVRAFAEVLPFRIIGGRRACDRLASPVPPRSVYGEGERMA
jgi:hypothetical protein